MLNTSVWKPFPRYMAEPEVEDLHEDVTPSEHDLIVRYTIIGIFVILATASLYLTKVIALPITAGIIFGLVLGPAGPTPPALPTGTVDGTLADIAATAAATAGGSTPTAAQVDTGIATAVASIVTGTNTQIKELQAKVNEIIAAAKADGSLSKISMKWLGQPLSGDLPG